MSRLIKKHIPSEEERIETLVKRHSKVYYSRLGKHRYVVVFPLLPHIFPYKQGLLIDDENYGTYYKVLESSIKGKLLEYTEIPKEVLNLIKRELRNGKYL